MDVTQMLAIRTARSMEFFCDGQPSFKWGEFKAWQKACSEQNKLIPPSEFKAMRKGDKNG
jgi:hypothetical protein